MDSDIRSRTVTFFCFHRGSFELEARFQSVTNEPLLFHPSGVMDPQFSFDKALSLETLQGGAIPRQNHGQYGLYNPLDSCGRAEARWPSFHTPEAD